jgi:hypothetical protein
VTSLLKTVTEERGNKSIPASTLLSASEISPFLAVQLAAWAAEVNFQDFFDGARSLLGDLRPSESPSHSPST